MCEIEESIGFAGFGDQANRAVLFNHEGWVFIDLFCVFHIEVGRNGRLTMQVLSR